MSPLVQSLEAEIRRLIAVGGPMPVAHYMGLCLGHPTHGYYMTHDPLGAAGDFTTAPEISQMFGELVGLWAAAVWRQMGSPENIQLIELGPGRGTMMMDALRAAQVMPGFRPAIVAHLVETSPVLAQQQQRLLDNIQVPVLWHERLANVPEGPAIILANEFFDALPVHQMVKQDDGWHERLVTVDADGNFAFTVAAQKTPHFEPTLPRQIREAPVDSLFEWRADAAILEVGRRVAQGGGAALVIDYGHTQSGVGDTLQAVEGHSYADPLIGPGLCDITAHVDFQALAAAGESIGARAHGPLTQGEFLQRLGIAARAESLKSKAPQRADDIDSALARLTGDDGGQRGTNSGMGMLFKVMALSQSTLSSLPGFE
jgi:NADH dehydrogenase [ubiquinone] 1 alpha subcomplex assembly factor 7